MLHKDIKISALAAFIITAIFTLLFIKAGGGRLALPLDDSYIYFQYAKQAAAGHWMIFTPGAEPSSGATSFLYLVLLTLASFLGYSGSLLPWAAMLIAGLCLFFSIYNLFRLARFYLADCPPYTFALLFLLSGPVLAGWFNGLEFALFAALLLAGFTNEALGGKAWRSTLWFSLLAFTRPEGQIAASLFAACSLWRLRGTPRLWGPALTQGLMAFAPSLLLIATTGSFIPDSSRPKISHLNAEGKRLEIALNYLRGVLTSIYLGLGSAGDKVGIAGDAASGNAPVGHFAPFALVLAVLGVFSRALRLGRRFLEDPLTPLVLFSGATLVLLAWNLPVGWNHHRYLLPTYPAILLAMGLALQELHPNKRNDDPTLFKAAYGSLWALLIVFGLLSVFRFTQSSVRMAYLYESRLGVPADAFKEYRPGARIASADVGLVAFRSQAPITDLLGVTDKQMAAHVWLGKGAATELLFSRPPGLRPEVAIIQDGRPDMDPRAWLKAGLLTRLGTVPASKQAPTTGIYEWNFDQAKFVRLPAKSKYLDLPESIRRRPSDRLNVGLPASETAHQWSGGAAKTILGVFKLRAKQNRVADGGRRVSALERFQMAVVPSKAGLLVARLRSAQEGSVELLIDGVRVISSAPLKSAEDVFQQVSLPFEASDLSSSEPTFFIRCRDKNDRVMEYASYHYWLYQ